MTGWEGFFMPRRRWWANWNVMLLICTWGSIPLAAAAQGAPPGGTVVRGQPVSVESRPLLTLGSREGDPAQEFLQVRAPFVLPSGQIVVPLAAFGEIRIFDPDGRLATTYGRPGEGPGEFRDLSSAWVRGDTIEAFDAELVRITRFHLDGTPEVVRLNPSALGYRLDSAIPGAFGDGWLVKGVSAFGARRRDEISVSRFSREGSFQGIVAKAESLHRDGSGGLAPLSPIAWFSMREGELYVGETATPAIRVVDGMGRPLREITWESERPSGRAAFREVLRLAVEKAPPERRRSTRERLESSGAPERVPAFSIFQLDDLGFLWVRPYLIERDAAALGGLSPASMAGGSWWVFSSDGARLGSLTLPPGLEPPYHITREAVVGVRRDELGVEYVQVHRLNRR
jgi:hypothetical protein